MIRKYIAVSALMLAGCWPAMADVAGSVADENEKPLQGASCVIYALPDSTYLSSTTSDRNGLFRLPDPESQRWFLSLSYLGCEERELDNDAVAALMKSEGGMRLTLNPVANALSEIVVKGRKPQLTMKDGVMSYNIKDILAGSVATSAHALLTELPLITSNDGTTLSLTGAPTGSEVYLNGRKAQISTSQLMDYLKNIPADQIENVEIIYTPSPKWQTSNSVINVVLRRQSAYSWNGQVTGSASYRHDISGSLGASVFAAMPKLSANVMYSFGASRETQKAVTEGRHSVDGTVYEVSDVTDAKQKTDSHNVYTSLEYRPDNKNTIGLTWNGAFTPKSDNSEHSFNSIYGDYDSEYSGNNNMNSVTLSYSHVKGISAGLEYTNFKTRRNQLMTDISQEEEALRGLSTQRIDKVRGYLDLTSPLGRNWFLSYGGNYEFSRNANYLDNISTDPDIMGDYSDAHIDENIGRLYCGFQTPYLFNHLYFNVSFAGEYYKAGQYDDVQLLPTAIVTYYHSQNHILQASYRRFRRYPSFWQRQDYVSYNNPYQVSIGNPELKPAIYDVASLMYLFRNKYVATFNYYRVGDFYLNQPYQSQTSLLLINQLYNIECSELYDLSVTIPFEIGRRLYSTLTLNANYERFKSRDWHSLSFDKGNFGGSVMLDNRLLLSTSPKIMLNVTGMYKMPSLAGLWERPHTWLLNAGITAAFLKEALTVEVKGYDLLGTLTPIQRVRLDSQHLDFDANYYRRIISLGITYRFRGYTDRAAKTVDTSRYGL